MADDILLFMIVTSICTFSMHRMRLCCEICVQEVMVKMALN